jgi:hypothetical protein
MKRRSPTHILSLLSTLTLLGLIGPFSDGKPPETVLPAYDGKGRYGYIDKTGQFVIPPKYGNAGDFSEGLAPVSIGGRWDIPTAFLAMVYVDGRWGYINTKDELVIKPRFLDHRHSEMVGPGAYPFSEGLAPVSVPFKCDGRPSTGTAWAYIDKSGNEVLSGQEMDKNQYLPKEISGSTAGSFSEGLAIYSPTGIEGFIDRQGRCVIPPQYVQALPFSEGLAAVEKIALSATTSRPAGDWGFIDRTGNLIIPFMFEHVGVFSEGLAPAGCPESPMGYIDRTGKFVLPPKYEWADMFREGLAPVGNQVRVDNHKVTLAGYITKTSQLAIGYRFAGARPFAEGLAAVEVQGKWGYINKQGVFVIPPRFDKAYSFSEGIARVWFTDKQPPRMHPAKP